MNLRISIKRLCNLFFVFSFALVLSGFNSGPAPHVRAEKQVHLDQFDMMTESSGWILIDQQLFWTSDAGQTWTEISPSIPAVASVEDIQFIDSNRGWLLSTTRDPNGAALFQLSHTNDSGISWETRALSLFKSGEIASYAEKAEMGWFDSQTGWISVKQTSGSNFSLGTLFTTSDGGSNWSRFTLPVADSIYFSDPFTGWATGGPNNDQIFKTQDVGVTWKSVRPADIRDGIQTKIYPPVTSGGHGLFVMTNEGAENTLKVYSLQNSSDQSLLDDQVEIDTQPGMITLSILDEQNFVAVISGTKSIVRMINGKLTQLENIDGLSTSIVGLDMVSLEVGWAKSIDSSCVTDSLSDPGTASVSCSSITRLLQTTNGGATLQTVNLPLSQINRAGLGDSSITNITNNFTSSAVSSGENTMAVIGQGFDRCEIPTLSQMQTWSVHSPYESVNLYIGGSNRACNNQALISSYLFQVYQQGWKFFPAWVGPQAPCTNYINRFSSDVATAHQQGVNEANLAVERLAELGLIGPLKTGSVIYYDMENYGTNTACRSAVNAFMNGWVSQIHTRGNLAGVYGSTLCNTGLSDFLTIANVPDVIWPARWYHNFGEGYYDPNANVWNLGSCVPNTAWSNHQRIRQYEGDHDETWGNLTLNIDSNVLDGVVAIPYDYPFVSSVVATDSNPTDATSLDFTINFSKSVTGVNAADFFLTTTDSISGATITNVTGSGNTYTVTVNTGSGNGTIRLNVIDDDTIKDGSNQLLGGSGIGNGNFNSGESYTIIKAANIEVSISGALAGNYNLAPKSSTRSSYAGLDNGPVRVTSTLPLVASERVAYSPDGGTTWTSYSELMGLPSNQVASSYTFPWYNNLDLNSQLRFGNVGTANTTVTVTVGGVFKGAYTLIPNESKRVSYAGLDAGPVRITSSGNVPIIASMRVAYFDGSAWTSFSEIMGMPTPKLTNSYVFPWYNNLDLNSQLRFGNVGAAPTTVTVTVAGVFKGSYQLAVNESKRVSYAGLDAGPVKVTSSGNVPIIASMRVAYNNGSAWTDFSEMMGLPSNSLSSHYSFPIYDNVRHNSQLRVGNVGFATTTVTITINGVLKDTFNLAPNGSRRVSYVGSDAGPVVIQSSGNVPIIASERVAYFDGSAWTSFSEMMGLPQSQLTTTFLFPWYNNVDLNSQLRFGVP